MSSWTEKDQRMFEHIRDGARRPRPTARRLDSIDEDAGVPRPPEMDAAAVRTPSVRSARPDPSRTIQPAATPAGP